MSAPNKFMPRLSKPRGVSRKRQGGFVRLGMNMARWGGKKKFTVNDLFRASEPGVHFEAYNPDSLLQRRNQMTYSDFPGGTIAQNGSATAGAGLLGTTALAGYDGAISYGYDGATTVEWVKALPASWAGARGTISVIVKMDDGNAPSFGSASLGDATNDFTFNIGTNASAIPPNTHVVTPVAGQPGYYRVSGTGIVGTGGNFGIRKNSTNSNRTFKTTAWQFEPNVAAATAYQKVTDWITEYLAAAMANVAMYQDSTSPVTAVEQSVGLWLDKSRGLQLGAELCTDSGLDTPASWATNAGWTVTGSKGVAAAAAVSTFLWQNIAAIAAGKVYEITATFSNITAGGVAFFAGNSGSSVSPTITSNGTYKYRVVAAGTGQIGFIAKGSAFTGQVDNVSFREVLGAHAWQATAGSRPKLSARYNLLTKTEQLTDAAWTKGASLTVTGNIADPLGGTAAARLTAAAASQTFYQPATVPSTTQTGTNKIWVRRVSGAGVVRLYGPNGSTSVVLTLTNQWQQFSSASTAPSGTSFFGPQIEIVTSGDVVEVAFPEARFDNDWALNQPAYQRVNTATDYDTAGFVHYLKFDGTDDSLATPNIDFSATSKMFVCVGATKLSDAATAVLIETSAQCSANDGTILLAAPGGPAAATTDFYWRSVVASSNRSASGLAAPITAIDVCLYDLSAGTAAGQCAPRVNGAAPTLTAGSALGAGSFTAQPLNIGRRNNASLPFNGRVTSLTARGSTTPTSAAFIKSMEQYAAKLAGQTFVST